MEVAKITSSQQAMDMEARYGAHNYHPLGVVIARGKGPFVWDVEGRNISISCPLILQSTKVTATRRLSKL